MREPAGAFPRQYPKIPSVATFHLIGNHGALVIVYRFNFGDGEVTVAQLGQGVLKCGVQASLEGEFCRRRKNAGVYPVGLAISIAGNELHLSRRGRASTLR